MKISKNIFQNWNKDIYIARKESITYDDYDNEIVEYSKPTYLGKINYQPMTGSDLYAYISAYGETKNKLARAYIDIDEYLGKISEFDVVYLYGKTPDGEKKNGQKANYKVKTVAPQNTRILVIFEEIIKEEK